MTREDINTIRKETLCKHELGKKVTIKAATCSSGGETSRTCKKCGYSETQYTAALEHTYKEKVCTECGAKAAPKDFIFGTFTKQGFVNEWMNLKFTPYNNMYSNPKTVIASYEASLNNPQYEFDAMEIMEYYVREGTSSNGLASVLVQKLKKTTTAEDYLEDNMREIEDAFRPYPQISVVRGEKGVYELCGEEYEYQKFSVVGGVSGTFHSMFLYRILDGYAINIQIQEGYYTIEEQLDCFEAIN